MQNERLERVEERIAWLERHVVEQDKVTLALTEEVERLKRELHAFRERLATREAAPKSGNPVDERPPHSCGRREPLAPDFNPARLRRGCRRGRASSGPG